MSKKYYLLGFNNDNLDSLVIAHDTKICEHSKTASCVRYPDHRCIVQDCKCTARKGILPLRYVFTRPNGETSSYCRESHALIKVEEDE